VSANTEMKAKSVVDGHRPVGVIVSAMVVAAAIAVIAFIGNPLLNER
jgi:hypothetical protein